MACDRQSLLAGCVSEAVRLRAPGIAVRMATCDLAMPLGGHRTVNVKKVRFCYCCCSDDVICCTDASQGCLKSASHISTMNPRMLEVES